MMNTVTHILKGHVVQNGIYTNDICLHSTEYFNNTFRVECRLFNLLSTRHAEEYQLPGVKSHQPPIITDHVRSTREVNVFSRVCPSVHRGMGVVR